MGCIEIHLRPTWAHEYLPMRLAVPRGRWHSGWFYMKNVTFPALPEHVLPRFTGSSPAVHSKRWTWGVPRKELKKIEDHLQAVRILKERGLSIEGVIGAYHQRRVAPLMARALPLHWMGIEMSPMGAALTEVPVSPSEVARRVWDVMEAQE